MAVSESLSFLTSLSGAITTGTVSVTGATSSTSALTGALVITGGAGVGGSLYVGGNAYATLFQSTSDLRLKTEISTLTDALDTVMQLRGVEYKWKSSGEQGMGLVAQEVQSVIPCAVVDNGEHLTVGYANLVGLLVEAVKELRQQVVELEKLVKAPK